jgi:hypothetical protein
MKSIAMMSAILSSFLACASMAQEVPSPQNLSLMGRGLIKKNSDESLALACLNPRDCQVVQFVYFKGAGEPEWVGPKIRLPSATNADQASEGLKAKLSYYLAGNPTVAVEQKRVRKQRSTASWLVMLGTGIAVSAAGSVSLGAGFLYLAPVGVAGIFLRAFPPASLDAFLVGTGDAITVSKSSDREGWNWSAHPKAVSAKKFDRLIQYLHEKRRYEVRGDGGPIDRSLKKIDQLQKAGVDFKFEKRRAGEF